MSIRVVHVFGGGVRSGIETQILTLAKGLKGSDVELVLAPLNNGSFNGEAAAHVSEIIPSDKKFRGDLGFVRRLAKRVAEAHVDIVHTHSYNGDFYGSRAARLAGIANVINTVHTFEMEALVDTHRSRLVRQVICYQNRSRRKSASILIAVCERLKEKLAGEGFDRNRIRVIPNGLDLQDYPFPFKESEPLRRKLGLTDDRPVIGSSGRISGVKRFDIFIRAARKVLDRGIPARFLIVGDGPLRGQMESLAAKLNLDEDILFAGWQEPEDLCRFVSVMDLFVLCSRTESMSYTLLEAMAMARPIVVTDVGGNREMVRDGESGLLVPLGDVETTAQSMIRLLENKKEATEFGLAGRKLLEARFQASTMSERTLEIYKELALNGAG